MSHHSRSTTPHVPALDAFFAHVTNLLGPDNASHSHWQGALRGPHGQESYGDVCSTNETHQPGGAVRPGTVEEVQQVVRLANTYKVPLWTVPRGKDLGYGGHSPVVEGTIILDLHRMNNIVEINEEYGYAIVKLGVSFFNLHQEIQRRGLTLWPSVPAIGWGSVLGNTLDRGFGYTPNGEH